MIAGRARVEEPARQRELPDRHPYDRGLAGERDGEDRPRGAGEVERAVLHVEHHRVEGLARQRLGDRRLVHAHPRAENRLLRRQRLRQFSDHGFAHVCPLFLLASAIR